MKSCHKLYKKVDVKKWTSVSEEVALSKGSLVGRI